MSYSVKDIRNVCLLGHSGSGKTALAESMLYMTKAIDRMGRAADGNTVCDSDPEEVKRQISLSTAVAPIDYQGCRINVLDAPGAFDFAGEVMEALSAADAAIIVCAAKDGVSVGVEKAWKYCEERQIPRFIYVSRIDEDNSDPAATLEALRARFGNSIIPYAAPDGKNVPAAIADLVASSEDELKEAAAGTSEELMEKFFDTGDLSPDEMKQGLRQAVREHALYPALFGSAVNGTGTTTLLDAIAHLAPNPTEGPWDSGPGAR